MEQYRVPFPPHTESEPLLIFHCYFRKVVVVVRALPVKDKGKQGEGEGRAAVIEGAVRFVRAALRYFEPRRATPCQAMQCHRECVITLVAASGAVSLGL